MHDWRSASQIWYQQPMNFRVGDDSSGLLWKEALICTLMQS